MGLWSSWYTSDITTKKIILMLKDVVAPTIFIWMILKIVA